MDTNTHHRKPRSLGGNGLKLNLFKNVNKEKHQLYHDMFGTLTPPEIVIKLCSMFPDYLFIAIPTKHMHHNAWSIKVNGHHGAEHKDKFLELWKQMFNGMNMFQCVESLNHWIDYEFKIRCFNRVFCKR